MSIIKKIALLALLASAFYGQPLSAQVTSSFNFSRGPQSVSGWINLYGDPSTASTPITATDASSGITVSSVGSSNWAPYNGLASSDGGGVTNGTFFPSGVMVNHWFQYSDYYALYNSLVPQLQISGLNVDSVYTLKMTGSFTVNIPTTFNLNPMRYTVKGAIIYGYVDVNGNYNTSNGAVFTNIAPDANGKIYVYVNTYTGSNVASICGLQVTRGRTNSPTPTVSIIKPTNNDVLPEDGNFTITAIASETNGTIARVEFYVDSTLVATDSSAPYSYNWISPDAGSYTLRARAVDGLGNTNTAIANVSVEPLSSFWSMTGNIHMNPDSNFVGNVDSAALAFRTKNIERVRITANGDVGIGTTNTQGYKLAVNGSAIFTKVKVKTAGTWPDYVFEKGYALWDLGTLERYLKEHRHLPGMIPASAAQQDGIDVAAQQAALLKKVEELTLYLIEENKRLKEQVQKSAAQHDQIEQLQKEMEALKKMIQAKN